MIVCRNCGHSNPDGTAWCQKPGCGVFLGSGNDPQSNQPVPTVPDARPIGPPPTQPAPATPATTATPTAAASVAGSPALGPPVIGPPVIGPPPRTETNPGAAWPAVDPVTAAVPSAESSASVIAPAPVSVPTVPTVPTEPTVATEPTEPTVPSVATEPTVPPPPPPDVTPPPDVVPTAGERPAGGGGARGLLVALVGLAVVAVVVVVGGYFYLTNRHDKPTAGKGPTATPTVVVTPVPAVVVSVGKVSSFATYNGIPRPPKALLDGKASTFWSARYRDKKPFVRFDFTTSETVVRIDIVNGAAGKGFVDRPSAKDITVKFPDGRAQTVQLEDQLGTVQSVAIDAPQAVKWVEILVNSVYDRPHGSNNMYLRTSIADVAFFSVANPSPSPTS